MNIKSMSEREVLHTSLETLQEELVEGVINLSGDLEIVVNLFKTWKENRIFLIQNLSDVCDKLQTIHRTANKATVTSGSVSLMGGVAIVGGLFVTSAISAPLLVAGGIVSGISTLFQVTTSAKESLLSHKLLRKCEQDIKKDAESLEKLLKSVDEYIFRIQYLEKLFKEKEELRKTKGVVETVYFGVRFGKSVMDYAKALNKLEDLLVDGAKVMNIFQKLSKNVKTAGFFNAFFKNTAKGATAKVAGGGLKMFAKRAFAITGVLFDVVTIASAADDLKKDSLPRAAEDLMKTVDILIEEKVFIDQIFSQIENETIPVITINDSDEEMDEE